MTARKGLRKWSFSTYRIDGPGGTVLIRRHGRKFLIGWLGNLMTPGFFTVETKRLREAREMAEMMVWQ